MCSTTYERAAGAHARDEVGHAALRLDDRAAPDRQGSRLCAASTLRPPAYAGAARPA